MRSGRTMAGVVLAGVLLAGCGGSGSQTGEPSDSTFNQTPVSAEDAAAIDAVVDLVYSGQTRKNFPGLWVGVWDPQRGAYTAARGEAVRGGTPASVDDTFRIGSVTKSFTATVVLQLVDEGKLALADTVGQAAPETGAANPDVADRTVAQLLSMSSGIPDYLNVPDGVVADISRDPGKVWATQELIDAAVSSGVKPAGTKGYSTTNYLLLQLIAEEITGQPLRELIAERLAEPLDMTVAALPPDTDTALPDPATGGYLNKGCVRELRSDGGKARAGQDVSDWNASYGQGGGGMQGTITDLGKWGASGLGGSLLEPATAEQRLQFRPLPEGIPYGQGVLDYGDGFVGHSGEAIGWEAQVAHNPDSGLTIAMGANACNGADFFLFGPLRKRIAAALAPQDPSAAPTATPSG